MTAITAIQRAPRRLLFLLVLSSLLYTTACSAAETPTATPEPSPTPTGVQYPLTVTDMLGRSVEIPQRPTRIVSISPTATETLYRIGGTAIARDSSSKFPPETEPLPTVGGAYNPSVETIIGLTPDLILIEALTQAHMLETLRSAGAPIVAVRATSLDDVLRSIALLGTVTDREEEAGQAAAEIQVRIDAASAAAGGTPGSVLILISDADRNLYAAKPESYPGTVAALLGATNVAEGLPDSGPFPGFTLFSGEQAVTSDPDFIFAISPAPEPAPRLSSVLASVPGYSGLRAITEGRLSEIDPGLFLSAPGPRIAEAVEEMARLLGETSE